MTEFKEKVAKQVNLNTTIKGKGSDMTAWTLKIKSCRFGNPEIVVSISDAGSTMDIRLGIGTIEAYMATLQSIADVGATLATTADNMRQHLAQYCIAKTNQVF